MVTRAKLAVGRNPGAARAAATGRIFAGLRALVALVIVLLQFASALHFTLVPHTFSAALGGVVHVHGGTRAHASSPRRGATPELLADAASCVVDICPFADAPHGSLPCAPATLSGVAAFGSPCLLTEAEARSPSARRVFLSAPKTSPPA